MPECVLVVDDDPAIREFVGQALFFEGYNVVAVANGEAALQAVNNCPPQVILLDMKMPILDGWGFLQAYCRNGESQAPIIAFSAHSKYSSQMLCVNEFLSKPFDLDKLLDLIAKYAPHQ
jgi:two-component system, chemotaxis family, chemotaxis protein CheY